MPAGVVITAIRYAAIRAMISVQLVSGTESR
jgi:hypothetical protein